MLGRATAHRSERQRVSQPATSLGDVDSSRNDPLFGLQAAADGTATTAWQSCHWQPGGQDGSGTYSDCAVDGEVGSVTGAFGSTPTVLAQGGAGVTVDASVVPDAVVVRRCTAGSCALTLVPVGDDHAFSAPVPVVSGVRALVAAVADPRGDALLVWTDARGDLYAATRDAGEAGASAPHRLDGPGIRPGSVRAVYGPRGEAIIAWSRAGATSAAVYDVGGRRAPRGPPLTARHPCDRPTSIVTSASMSAFSDCSASLSWCIYRIKPRALRA